jgi:hypothetical protein
MPSFFFPKLTIHVMGERERELAHFNKELYVAFGNDESLLKKIDFLPIG